jgi:annexin D
MMLWATNPAARDAKLAHEALKQKGDGRHVCVLIEAACASTPDHLVAVRKAYCAAYDASLEEDVAACPFYKDPPQAGRCSDPEEDIIFPDRSGHTHRVSFGACVAQFLVRLVSSFRCSGQYVDEEVSRAEAAELHQAVVAGKQPLHDGVVRIISTS